MSARSQKRWRLGVCVAALLLALPALAEVFTADVTTIPDGDTLWVKPVDGSAPRKLRLLGIDAPEICQSGGVAARAALVQLVNHQRVRVSVKYYDSYQRGLAQVQLGNQDVAAVLVRAGQAWSSRWHQSLGPYAADEAAARAAKLGLFAEPAPELPRDFRQRHGSCYLFDAGKPGG